MKKPNYYALLGVSHQADLVEIKAAYRKLVMKFHPDKNENNQEHTDLFLQIQQAYEVLSHPSRRKNYDEKLFYSGLKSKSKQVAYDFNWLFNQLEDLQIHVSKLDEYSLNQAALSDYVLSLISLPQFEFVFHEVDVNQRKVINEKMLMVLQKLELKHLDSILTKLRIVYMKYENMIDVFEVFYALKKRQKRLSSLRPWLVLCVVGFLCWLMVLYAR